MKSSRSFLGNQTLLINSEVERGDDRFVTITDYGAIVLVNVTVVAGARVESPAWEKVNTHDPAATAVSEYAPGVPLTVQNSELASALVMVTGRP